MYSSYIQKQSRLLGINEFFKSPGKLTFLVLMTAAFFVPLFVSGPLYGDNFLQVFDPEYGNCGNVVCCKRFLNTFSIVSIKMMKEQSLALNPAKISGVCGRLMCCLAYEHDMYLELKRNFPKVGKRVTTPQGEGKVIKHSALTSSVMVLLDDGREIMVPVKDVALLQAGGA